MTDTWFTLRRWQVIDAASRKVLYRESKTTSPRFFITPDNGMAQHTLTQTVYSLFQRGLAVMLPESTNTGRPIRLTEPGKRVRSQWFHPDGRKKPFPYPGLITPPRHSIENHYILWMAERRRRMPVDAVPNSQMKHTVDAMDADGLIDLVDNEIYELSSSGAALLGGWRSLPRGYCSCGID